MVMLLSVLLQKISAFTEAVDVQTKGVYTV